MPRRNGYVADVGDLGDLLMKYERMGEDDGEMGAMRGKAPEMGDCRGDTGEVDPESEEESDMVDSERRRLSIGIGSECGMFFSLEGMVNNIL